jgi:lauroyl/myristoyl acyltransferase
MRWLNPLWMAVEERFLQERVMVDGSETAAAMSVLRSRLAENGIVAIFFGNEGRRTTEAPFLNHRIRVATGPVAMACSTRAALMPLFALRSPDETFDVILEEPLEVPSAGDDGGAFDKVAAAMVRRLEPYARRYPEQWRGWNELLAVDAAEELTADLVTQARATGNTPSRDATRRSAT